MTLALVRLVGVLIGFVRAVPLPVAADAYKQEPPPRFGVAIAGGGDVCVAVEGPELAPGALLTVIDLEEDPPRLFTFVVDGAVRNCPLLEGREAVGTQYRAHLADGELPSSRILGIAMVGTFSGRMGKRGFTLDLGPNLPAARVSTCTSREGLYLNLWSAAPRKSTLLWQMYWYLGFEAEPTCTRAEYKPTKPRVR